MATKRRSKSSAIEELGREFGARPFRVGDAIEVGIPRTTLHRLVTDGELESPSRGILQFPGGGLGTLSDFALVSARAPSATICLNSALSYWDLTDEVPSVIHIAVPSGVRKPRIFDPETKAHVFNAKTFELGRAQTVTDVGEPFWVYSPERSIVDAIRMARWVGRDVGLHALRRYVNRPRANPSLLMDLSRQIDGARNLAPELEAILS